MNLKKLICEAFCEASAVTEVAIGYAVRAPFIWLSGEPLIYYARLDGNMVRFEDDGATIFEIEAAGVDMSNSTRLAVLDELCGQHAVTYDIEDVTFRSGWAPVEQAGPMALKFLSFMLRVQDLAFTSKERTASTFKDDLVAAILGRGQGSVTVDTNEAPLPTLGYYTVDVVVRNILTGQTAAVFPGTSEQKALEAILFSKEIELRGISDIAPFLILENAGSPRIHRNTQTKAMNSNLLQMAAWDGGAEEVVDKVFSRIGIAPPPAQQMQPVLA